MEKNYVRRKKPHGKKLRRKKQRFSSHVEKKAANASVAKNRNLINKS
jgi:hypothetical protein